MILQLIYIFHFADAFIRCNVHLRADTAQTRIDSWKNNMSKCPEAKFKSDSTEVSAGRAQSALDFFFPPLESWLKMCLVRSACPCPLTTPRSNDPSRECDGHEVTVTSDQQNFIRLHDVPRPMSLTENCCCAVWAQNTPVSVETKTLPSLLTALFSSKHFSSAGTGTHTHTSHSQLYHSPCSITNIYH